MKLKKSFLNILVVTAVFFMGLGCTCLQASTTEGIRASMPSCHMPEATNSSESKNCCGKCESNNPAIIQSKTVAQASADSGHIIPFFALSAEKFSFPFLPAIEPALSPGFFENEKLFVFQSAPRAPPVQ